MVLLVFFCWCQWFDVDVELVVCLVGEIILVVFWFNGDYGVVVYFFGVDELYWCGEIVDVQVVQQIVFYIGVYEMGYDMVVFFVYIYWYGIVC